MNGSRGLGTVTDKSWQAWEGVMETRGLYFRNHEILVACMYERVTKLKFGVLVTAQCLTLAGIFVPHQRINSNVMQLFGRHV